jgi:hypothetical protein
MPALRIFDPYAFLGGEDRSAAPAKAANLAKAAEAEVETLATLAALAGACPTIEKPTKPDQVAQGCLATAQLPVLLADGRRLHRFRANTIPTTVPGDAATLLEQARWQGAVLVADGEELIVVERWQSALPPETLKAFMGRAGAIIAVLRGESRRRYAEHEGGPHD